MMKLILFFLLTCQLAVSANWIYTPDGTGGYFGQNIQTGQTIQLFPDSPGNFIQADQQTGNTQLIQLDPTLDLNYDPYMDAGYDPYADNY